MEYEWDEAKAARNKEKHKIGFEAVEDFEWNRALVVDRSRHEDGEKRYAAIGPIEDKLYTVIYTWRKKRRRIISVRRANGPEEKAYEENF